MYTQGTHREAYWVYTTVHTQGGILYGTHREAYPGIYPPTNSPQGGIPRYIPPRGIMLGRELPSLLRKERGSCWEESLLPPLGP